MTITKAERQARDAFIDGFLSACDKLSPGDEYPHRRAAERAWRNENTTDEPRPPVLRRSPPSGVIHALTTRGRVGPDGHIVWEKTERRVVPPPPKLGGPDDGKPSLLGRGQDD